MPGKGMGTLFFSVVQYLELLKMAFSIAGMVGYM